MTELESENETTKLSSKINVLNKNVKSLRLRQRPHESTVRNLGVALSQAVPKGGTPLCRNIQFSKEAFFLKPRKYWFAPTSTHRVPASKRQATDLKSFQSSCLRMDIWGRIGKYDSWHGIISQKQCVEELNSAANGLGKMGHLAVALNPTGFPTASCDHVCGSDCAALCISGW